MKRLFFVTVLTATSFIAAFAQKIQGNIVDASSGESIIGAAVRSDDGKGVLSDYDGHFTIEVKTLPVTLDVSYTGYKSQSITVYDDEEPVEVKLIEKRNYLDDVVIVGYGSQSRAQLTGSVTTVKADVFENSASATLDGALSGQVAGLNVRD